MMSRGEGILKIPREFPRIAREKRGLTSPRWEPIFETSGHDGFTRSLDAHTPDLLDSSDPLDSLDPNLASVRTYNHHFPPARWFNGSQAHVGMLDHVMSAALGSLKTGTPVLGHVTGQYACSA